MRTCSMCGTEQLLRRNVKRFRGGLVFKAHRFVYHSTLGWRVTKKKGDPFEDEEEQGADDADLLDVRHRFPVHHHLLPLPIGTVLNLRTTT